MPASDKFDLVLYGATGFTGRLAVRYVVATYPGMKFAIAGRSQAKLETLKADLGNDDVSILVADSSDKAALTVMVSQAKVVAAMAGPFSRYGTLLVECCAEAGVDYCDITGETNWVRQMIAKYDDVARKSGARIVNLCGHDSVPWDLSTYLLAKKLKEGGEDLVRIDFYDDIKSAPSGGTLETALGIMFGKEKGQKFAESKALGYDALLKLPDSTKSTNALKARNVGYTVEFPKKRSLPYRSFFFMASVNANTVKRSNAINGYGSDVLYTEGTAFKSFAAAVWHVLSWAVYGLGLYVPPLRYLMQTFYLPKPGEGPSEDYMDAGYLHLTGIAKGSKGTVVKSTMSFNVDPGYKDTARMVVESALSLSLEGDKIKCGGGVHTPAACQKEVLMERLLSTGTSFTYH